MNFERVSGWCELIEEFAQRPLTSELKARSIFAVVPSAYAASVQKDLVESEEAFFENAI